MSLKHPLCAVALAATFLVPLTASADHHEAGEVEAAVHAFYRDLRAADFQSAFGMMKLGARGYLPVGVLRDIPTEEVRAAVAAAYSELFDEGDLNLTPQYVKVSVHGTVAVATFLAQGGVQRPEDDEPEEVVQRGTIVWEQSDSGWLIVHYHVSDVKASRDD